MTTTVQEHLLGRPRFAREAVSPETNDNSLFGKRRFSTIATHSYTKFFKQKLYDFIHYFLPTSALYPQTIRTFSDSHSTNWINTEASQGRFTKHFSRFLHDTENTSLSQRACFDGLAKWSNEIERASRMMMPEQRAAAEQKLREKLTDTISNLQTGEMCLLPAHFNPNDPLFYLFVKTRNLYV